MFGADSGINRLHTTNTCEPKTSFKRNVVFIKAVRGGFGQKCKYKIF